MDKAASDAGRGAAMPAKTVEDWEAGPERSVAKSGTALPGSGGASGSGLDPWEAAAASAGGGSSSSAPRPAPARGPVPPPRPLLEICPRGNNKMVIIIFPCS